MLGVAVTCSNKLLFISKIQSLDETTQHALTACVASFIYTKVSSLHQFIFSTYFNISRNGRVESPLRAVTVSLRWPPHLEMRFGHRNVMSLTFRYAFKLRVLHRVGFYFDFVGAY